jgi:hypothetical protein
MSGIIETHPNPVSKETVREAIISKAIVDSPGESYESIHANSIRSWLFGSHDMLRYLLNHIKHDDSRELNKMYKRYMGAKTETIRQKNLDRLVDSIHEYLDGVFTSENYPKFVAAHDKAQRLVDNGVMVSRNKRVVDDFTVLLNAPLWDNVMNQAQERS